eukprot:8408180-Pyramimonas_sp.AAC.1
MTSWCDRTREAPKRPLEVWNGQPGRPKRSPKKARRGRIIASPKFFEGFWNFRFSVSRRTPASQEP